MSARPTPSGWCEIRVVKSGFDTRPVLGYKSKPCRTHRETGHAMEGFDMAKNMDRGNTGRDNKPKLTLKEKLLKKKMKKQAKAAAQAGL